MRIVSLLSSATEILHALDATDRLVGISHECDHPPHVLSLPRVSGSRFDPEGLSSGEVDAAVRDSMARHGSVYEIDADLLRELRPDLLLTQAVCEVCAVPFGSAEAIASMIEPRPRVLSLDAHDIGGILTTIEEVGEAIGERDRAQDVVQRLRDRLDRVSAAVSDGPRPRVLVLEWLDPPFDPGHWMPEVVGLAGGRSLRGSAGVASREAEWADLEGLDPDVLLIAPCGWGIQEARREAARHSARLEQVAGAAIEEGRAFLLNGAFYSRSGPRVVDGVEAMAAALHPGTAGMPDPEFLVPWHVPS